MSVKDTTKILIQNPVDDQNGKHYLGERYTGKQAGVEGELYTADGSTIYGNNNPIQSPWENGITTSNVDYQDEQTDPDLTIGTENFWSNLGNAIDSKKNEIGSKLFDVSGASAFGAKKSNKGGSGSVKSFGTLDSIKSNYYKDAILSSKTTVYGDLTKLISIATGSCVGSLGGGSGVSTLATNAVDKLVNKFTKGLGASQGISLLTNLLGKGAQSLLGGATDGNISTYNLSASEMAAIQTANPATMYLYRPGRTVKYKNSNIDASSLLNETEVEERSEVGELYIEPFYNPGNSTLTSFTIPFEFNPDITEGSNTASYDEVDVMGRTLKIKSYTGSDEGDYTLSTMYIVTADGIDYGKQSGNSSGQYGNNSNNILSWMDTFTPIKIKQIENQYRMLNLPYISGDVFVRPPIVRIHIGNSSNYTDTYNSDNIRKTTSNATVNDLFKYPDVSNRLQTTKSFDSNNTDYNREKKFIVKDVKIEKLGSGTFMQNGYFYDDNGNVGRFGFKVTLTLSVTTKNFTDQIPNYADYMNLDYMEDTSPVVESEYFGYSQLSNTNYYSQLAKKETSEYFGYSQLSNTNYYSQLAEKEAEKEAENVARGQSALNFKLSQNALKDLNSNFLNLQNNNILNSGIPTDTASKINSATKKQATEMFSAVRDKATGFFKKVFHLS